MFIRVTQVGTYKRIPWYGSLFDHRKCPDPGHFSESHHSKLMEPDRNFTLTDWTGLTTVWYAYLRWKPGLWALVFVLFSLAFPWFSWNTDSTTYLISILLPFYVPNKFYVPSSPFYVPNKPIGISYNTIGEHWITVEHFDRKNRLFYRH